LQEPNLAVNSWLACVGLANTSVEYMARVALLLVFYVGNTSDGNVQVEGAITPAECEALISSSEKVGYQHQGSRGAANAEVP
jgi:hypothetical protein